MACGLCTGLLLFLLPLLLLWLFMCGEPSGGREFERGRGEFCAGDGDNAGPGEEVPFFLVWRSRHAFSLCADGDIGLSLLTPRAWGLPRAAYVRGLPVTPPPVPLALVRMPVR